MEQFVIQKPDGHEMSCMKEAPANPEGIVIAVHGFASSMASPTYTLLMRRMPEANLGVVAFDLPGHGSRESLQEELRIEGALDSISAAERYATEQWPEADIFYFGSSFGAYLLCLYISRRPHRGRRVFLRSAAVNMPELFVPRNPTEEDLKAIREMEERGYVDVVSEGHQPVRISVAMYRDFERTDLFQCFSPDTYGPHEIEMVHGTEDQVIDPAQAELFAEKFDLSITYFPGEGHTLSNDHGTPDRVADLALQLYRG